MTDQQTLDVLAAPSSKRNKDHSLEAWSLPAHACAGVLTGSASSGYEGTRPQPGGLETVSAVNRLVSEGLPLKLFTIGRGNAAEASMPAAFEIGPNTFVLAIEARPGAYVLSVPGAGQVVAPYELIDQMWTGRILASDAGISPRPDFLRNLFSRFGVLSQSSTGNILEFITANAMLHAFTLLVPVAFGLVIDKVYPHQGYATLDTIASALVIIALMEAFFILANEILKNYFKSKSTIETYFPLVSRIISLPMGFHLRYSPGDVAARLKRIPGIFEFRLEMIDVAFIMPVFMGVTFVAMLLYSQVLTLVTVAATIVQVGVFLVFRAKIRRHARATSRQRDEADARLSEALAGIATLKGVGAEASILHHWEKQTLTVLERESEGMWMSTLLRITGQLKTRLTTVMVIWIGAMEMFQGTLSVGELVTFSLLLRQFNAMAERITPLWFRASENKAMVERIAEIADVPPEGVAQRTLIDHECWGEEIRFEGVRFAYSKESTPVLNDISVEIAPRGVLGVVGPSGSGKSTFVQLLQRLHDPSSGRITIGGMDLHTIHPRTVRRHIANVSQDSQIFNLSVLDNILLGRSSDVERAVHAAQSVGIHDTIMSLPRGYDTILADRGLNLSAGQRQRIAIARVLVTDPEIVILDEATNALDHETEAQLVQKLAELSETRLVIAVAHRPSAVRNADRVLCIAKGHIIEDGPPDTLMAQDGFFAHMMAQGGKDPTEHI